MKHHIPRGRVRNYKPFCNETLRNLEREGTRLREVRNVPGLLMSWNGKKSSDHENNHICQNELL